MSSLSSYNYVWKHLTLPDMCSIDSFKNYLQPNKIGSFVMILIPLVFDPLHKPWIYYLPEQMNY